ncbi:hypothetical protein J2D69_19290 [Lysinibacillus sphaericus]|uniref:SF3 helicase domain-containing protein n=5 Tax=Bacillaceae TaxID=186817 RepID=B1HWF2_LYSSC|nr:phage/plasmid primase, P4 family [Lysinibacillus sphaericus]ACA38109.1 conserved hypothetical protein [Lysinibacillus sphaericus C3-41]AMO32279.1 hypothetical protein AR327_07260 [Lysinibacillus sphaericus]AMR92622.1 hypothetical protein A1T07_21950 [Lysinibacillus sphaericus]ANA46671.1 hypothetical protein A2J09_14620 [Lysinibacillus sphaericus]KZL46084.1 hypothetical protein A2J08_14975 [Lysinibacillus sphaericus]
MSKKKSNNQKKNNIRDYFKQDEQDTVTSATDDLFNFTVRSGSKQIPQSDFSELTEHNEQDTVTSATDDLFNFTVRSGSKQIPQSDFSELTEHNEQDTVTSATDDLFNFTVRSGSKQIPQSDFSELTEHNEQHTVTSATDDLFNFTVRSGSKQIPQSDFSELTEHNEQHTVTSATDDLFNFTVRSGSKQIPQSDFSELTEQDGDDQLVPKQSQRVTEMALSNKKKSNEKSNYRLSEYELSKILLANNQFVMNKYGVLYYWDNLKGYYIALVNKNSDRIIRKIIPENSKKYINSNKITEILVWIKSSDELVCAETNTLSSKYLISFSNYVYDIKNEITLDHSSRYFITNKLNANFTIPLTSDSGIHFEKFLNTITQNDSVLYDRLQELFGYVLSEIRDIKYIPILIGQKDTGKSVILKLLEYIIGEDNFSNISIDQFNNSVYLAELYGKRLNSCAEISELNLKRLDILKKLSGNDYVTARPMYSDPIKFINQSVLLFAGNNLPNIENLDSSSAFKERLLLFPFNNPIPKEHQDNELIDKLIAEIDYIAHWSIKGIHRLLNNNFQFTTSFEIEDTFKPYLSNSLEEFLLSECAYQTKYQIHTDDLYQAYIVYCENYSFKIISKKSFIQILKKQSNLSFRRFRMRGTNKYGFIGIGLKNF